MEKESICRNCFHSYVCEQFKENKDDSNEKCHFFNDHYVPTADVVPKSEGATELFADLEKILCLCDKDGCLKVTALYSDYAELKKKYTEEQQ